MKRLIFLLAGFVFFSGSGWANDSSFGVNSSSSQWNNNPNQSFIFIENGIEFSVFQDGQFDFFIPNNGPNVSVGFNTSNVNFSFNSGYNYNPFVQYDSYGAVIQIQNTPVFYDYYGRVQQIGSLFIGYNNYGLVNRIGGLQVFYRNNAFWRQSGFINQMNRSYVWRPWHRYYAMPAAQFCLISSQPYRQFYTPVRHIYYRPYKNNSRHFAFNRQQPHYRAKIKTNRSQRYAQTARTDSERINRSNVQRRQDAIHSARNTRTSNANSSSSNRRNYRSTSEENDRTYRDVASRTNRTAREMEHNSRRDQTSSRTIRNTNNRSISQDSRRTEQVRSNNRKSDEVSARTPNRRTKVIRTDARKNSVQTNPASYNKKASKAEKSLRTNNGKSSRKR